MMSRTGTCEPGQEERTSSPTDSQSRAAVGRPRRGSGARKRSPKDRRAVNRGWRCLRFRIASKRLSALATRTANKCPPPELGEPGTAHELGVLAEDRLYGLTEGHGLGSSIGHGRIIATPAADRGGANRVPQAIGRTGPADTAADLYASLRQEAQTASTIETHASVGWFVTSATRTARPSAPTRREPWGRGSEGCGMLPQSDEEGQENASCRRP